MNALHGHEPRSRGFSLIELMVAVVVGLFLVGGLATLMVSTRVNYETQDQSSRLQENARFAMEFMSYDLRHAGYAGCADLGVQLLDGAYSGAYGDQIVFGYSDPNQVISLTSEALTGATSLQVSTVAGLAVNDLITIADCGASFETEITGMSGNTLTINPALPRFFTVADAVIHPFESHVYDVQLNPDGLPGLYRDGVEIVEGVEFIRVLYGEDTDADGAPDVYRPEDEISNWNTVYNLKLGMLVRSISNHKPDDNTTREYGIDIDAGPYDILDLNAANSTAVTPPQGSIQAARRVFTNTILVRNQI